MSFDFGSRCVGFRGFSVAFLLLLLTLVGFDCIDVNVTATVGNAADLPCTCPPDQPPYLVWQKNVDGKKLLVNYHKNNNENYPIALEFQNRTKLKRSGDSCFLVFHSVRLSDEGLYMCYYAVSPLRCNNTYLEVTAKDHLAGHQDVQNTAVISAVCVCLIIVIVVVAVYVGVTCKNRHQMNRTFIATSTGGFNSCQ